TPAAAAPGPAPRGRGATHANSSRHSLRSRLPLHGGDAGDLTGPVPVDREQHRAEHPPVVLMDLTADGGDQVLSGPGRVPVTPGRDRDPRPGQLPGSVLAVPHDGLRL